MDKKGEFSKSKWRDDNSFCHETFNPTFTETTFRNQKREISELIAKHRTKSISQEVSDLKLSK